MTVECLLATGLTEFQVSVGQVDYYKAIFAQTGLSQEEERRASGADFPEKLFWCGRACKE